MRPSEYLYFPIKNGKWLRDSQGKPRVYKSARLALRNLEKFEYDSIQIYAVDDVVSREEFEGIFEKEMTGEDFNGKPKQDS